MDARNPEFAFSQPAVTLNPIRHSYSNVNQKSFRSLHSKRNYRCILKKSRGSRRIYTCCTKPEPVEDGVVLPQPANGTLLEDEGSWLSNKLTDWLDKEWLQDEPSPIHEQIAKRTAQIYVRQRMEGENDLTSVMLAIGSELEGMNFSDAFVGPWNVANRAAELLFEYHIGEVAVNLDAKSQQNASTIFDLNNTSKDTELEKVRNIKDPWVSTDRKKNSGAVSPSLADAFERYKFLKDILDGTASSEVINGVVACAMGYRYDLKTGIWDNENVEDERFKVFGNTPPDLLGNENDEDTPEILRYLEGQLKLDENDVREGLHMVIETIHGVELTRMQMNDENDHSFRKRCIVAKWLHLCGGF